MQDDAYLSVLAFLEHEALVHKNMAVILPDEMNIALHDRQIAMQDEVLLAVPQGFSLKPVSSGNSSLPPTK